MKVIVTHMRPDLDAVGAVWSIKRFLPNWEEAQVQFVPAGQRLDGKEASENVIEKIGRDDVIHVDTGLGPLDHHQTSEITTCAAKRAWEWSIEQRTKTSKNLSDHLQIEIEAGNRLMDVICEIDHFREVFWPDSNSDRYDITVSRILDGLKIMNKDDDNKIVDFGLVCLDALLKSLQNKVVAEKELGEKGREFKTKWGKGIGIESFNDDVLHIAQKRGYVVAVRKDPAKQYIRIKVLPKEGTDLTGAYEKLKVLDPDATWFLHVSKRMLLNGTTKNPKMKPTKLSLDEIIEVLEKL